MKKGYTATSLNEFLNESKYEADIALETLLAKALGKQFLLHKDEILDQVYTTLGMRTISWAFNELLGDYPELEDYKEEFYKAAAKEGYKSDFDKGINESEPILSEDKPEYESEEQVWKDLEFIVKNKWNRKSFNADPKEIDQWLDYANDKLEGYGVEPIRNPGEFNKYWGDTVALYVNMGDTYVKTVLYDVKEKKFHITTWGDWAETHLQEE